MPLPTAYVWSKAPFIRLLVSLIAGIILQWQFQFSFNFLLRSSVFCFIIIVAYQFLSLKAKYKFRVFNGIFIFLLIAFAGAVIVWLKDVRNNSNNILHHYKDGSFVAVTIEEPLIEKSNSYKALASVNCIYADNICKPTEGKIILYFKKDSSVKNLHYGSQIVFKKTLQQIKNAGNPGSFDYKRYSLFQGITYQVFLLPADFENLPTENKDQFRQFIFNCRNRVITTLQKFIKGSKEQGLAEALLIGYKDDLDKNLVQSYTNTGVVHIIAISGMHLALIYGLLILLTKPLRQKKQFNFLRVIIILTGLWLFTLLAGAQASVVRSAVMFTCIAVGELLLRKTTVYNTLALSAFLLLCYNPFWLWDVGFQLSYAAVLSIIIFFRPIYNWLYFPNKLIDALWKLNALSLAAQIFTTPVSIYHFHQFPVLFLLTNIVAVPLSGIILFGEIGLCVFSFVKPVGAFIGFAVQWLIYFMNSYIERIEKISFALWDGFSISVLQTVCLTMTVAALSYWLLENKKQGLKIAFFSVGLFLALRSIDFWEAYHQKKIIVYNVPKNLAIDLVNGRTYNFIGDSVLLFDDFTRNFHLQPSRILHRIKQYQVLSTASKEFEFCTKKIAIIDSAFQFVSAATRQQLDLLILSKTPKLYISNLVKTFSIRQIVLDGSVPVWKAKLWKKDCDSLHIPCHDVSEKGAFVMNIN